MESSDSEASFNLELECEVAISDTESDPEEPADTEEYVGALQPYMFQPEYEDNPEEYMHDRRASG